jgi:hypothetical protein
MKHFLSFFLMAAPMLSIAQQTNYHFSDTEQTTASAEAIWKIWTDVPNWKQWDDGLKESTLEGDFKVGAKGKLIPDKGPKSKFVVSEMQEGKSYTFKTRIPFGWLIIERTLQNESGTTSFTHDVQFTGLLKKALGKKIGKRYREMLPSVMVKIKKLAEQ